MGRTYMRVYAILFGTLIGFTTYFYTIQDMKAKMQTEAVQLEYIGGAPGGYKGGSKAKNEAEVTSKWNIVLILRGWKNFMWENLIKSFDFKEYIDEVNCQNNIL